jgi:hypothetical protein
MKTKRRMTRKACFEVLECRLTLSAASAAVVPAATAAQAAASAADVAPTTHDNPNWSGYAITAQPGTVSYVAGTWTVPTVNTAADGHVSVWVGIDGHGGSKGLEQVGTGQKVIKVKGKGKEAVYSAWYEMLPSDEAPITMTVNPGDSMTGSVAYVSVQNKNYFVLTLVDNTTGTSFSTTQDAPNNPSDSKKDFGSRSSAEWVVEDPTDASTKRLDTLASYGTVTFTNAYATIDGKTAQIDYWPSSLLNMTSHHLVESSTSGLTDSVATSALPTGSTDTYSGTVSSFTTTFVKAYRRSHYSAANVGMLVASRTTAHSTTTDSTTKDDSDDTETNGTMISDTLTQQPDHGWRFGRATNRHRQNPPATSQPHHAQSASTSSQAAREQLFGSLGRLI